LTRWLLVLIGVCIVFFGLGYWLLEIMGHY
jgi:hypothetical protein